MNHRKPTKLLKLAGTFRADRHAPRTGEVNPEQGIPEPPDWMLPEALMEWERLAADSEYAAALCKIDRAMIATYCQLWARFVEGEKTGKPVKVSHVAAMANLGAKLGLNPSDRSRVRGAAPTKPTNSWRVFSSNADRSN